MSNGYQINEKGIDPQKATPEMVITMSERSSSSLSDEVADLRVEDESNGNCSFGIFQGCLSELAHTDPGKLEEILEDLQKKTKNSA